MAQAGIVGDIHANLQSQADSGSGRLGGGTATSGGPFTVGGGMKTSDWMAIAAIVGLGVLIYTLVKKV